MKIFSQGFPAAISARHIFAFSDYLLYPFDSSWILSFLHMHVTFFREVNQTFSEKQAEKISQAYAWASEVYRSNKAECKVDRKSACERSFDHAVAVAENIIGYYPDFEAVIAALFHEFPVIAPQQLPEVKKRFGKDVHFILQNLDRLMQFDLTKMIMNVEALRKLFLKLAKDIRVVMIRFVDRLEFLRTIDTDKKVTSFARDRAFGALNVYAPVAARLGIYRFKVKLEDAAFRVLEPKKYREIHDQVLERIKRRYEAFVVFQKSLAENLQAKLGFSVTVSGRVKSVYSIYIKFKKKNSSSLQDVLDLFAVRVILPDTYHNGHEDMGHCYQALGYIHSLYVPLMQRFKDYIAMPKWNGYRSLHTTIMGVGGVRDKQPFELQIRTEGMHQDAEFGIASHWWYDVSGKKGKKNGEIGFAFSPDHLRSFLKNYECWDAVKKVSVKYADAAEALRILREGGEGLDERVVQHHYTILEKHGLFKGDVAGYFFLERQGQKHGQSTFKNELEWLQRLNMLQRGHHRLVQPARMDLDIFQDLIFVLTPDGRVQELPIGATPVDFAYALDVEIGHRCRLAKVNGKIVSLDKKLRDGDTVEILQHATPEPNRFWLSFAVTLPAREAIKAWFHALDYDAKVAAGKKALNKALLQIGRAELDEKNSQLAYYNNVSDELTLPERERILEGIGEGTIMLGEVLERMATAKFSHDRQRKEAKKVSAADLAQVRIAGEKGLPLKLAQCCTPGVQDQIVGYVTRGTGVTIHRFNCLVLRNNSNSGQRLVHATWGGDRQTVLKFQLDIKARDRIGLLKEISGVMADLGINIVDTQIVRRSGDEIVRRFVVSVQDYEMFERIWFYLYHLQDVEVIDQVQFSG